MYEVMRDRIGNRVIEKMKSDREEGIEREYSDLFEEAYQEILEEIFISARMLHIKRVDGEGDGHNVQGSS